jgi:hypothetical protein
LERDGCAFVQLAVYADLAVMRGYHALHNGKPQPQTTDFTDVGFPEEGELMKTGEDTASPHTKRSEQPLVVVGAMLMCSPEKIPCPKD